MLWKNKDTKNKIEDYLNCFRELNQFGNYVTINISSPNTENLRNFHNPQELEELLKLLNDEKNKLNSNTNIAVKISPDININELDVIGNILLKYKIKIVIISNTSDRTRDNLKNIIKFENTFQKSFYKTSHIRQVDN